MDWRRARLEDSAEISRLSFAILGELGEPAEIFAERIVLCPEGCYVLADEGRILGHLISHPWVRGTPPAMNQRLGQIPRTADCWYIHEVALLAQARGRGYIRAILHHLKEIAVAHGFSVVALVAVEGADAYWQRLGFRPAPLDAAGIQSYGGQAAYLEMHI